MLQTAAMTQSQLWVVSLTDFHMRYHWGSPVWGAVEDHGGDKKAPHYPTNS